MARKKGRRSKPFKVSLKKDTVSSILAVLTMAIGGLVMISFSRQGVVLETIYAMGSAMFGWVLILIPFVLISGGLLITRVKWQIARPQVFLGSLVTVLGLVGLTRAGQIGSQTFESIAALITPYGSGLLFATGIAIGQLIFWETSLEDLAGMLSQMGSTAKATSKALPKAPKLSAPSIFPHKEVTVKGMPEMPEKPIEVNQTPEEEEEAIKHHQPGAALSPENAVWRLPPLNLLSDMKRVKADRGDIKANIATIERTLGSFGIDAHVIEVNMGPAVTQYAMEIAVGTKLSKIVNLQSDLALALSAPSGQIRIEAPIPGRNLVGIEVPNHSLEMVSLKQMLTSDTMKTNSSKLAVALGLNVAGEPTIADIGKMPHVLVAGSTGSGKSVCINAFIASMLFRASPSEVKLILVDPKRVELTGYNGIPHLLTPVITDPEKVVAALKWCVAEMDRRYKLLAEVGARNISKYNEISGFHAMPYIVVIIDELADIMLSNPRDVEEAITRVAQMARAVGIHLILATQRPSVNIITGLIKANIPTRIAFNVTSMIDSRVILDTPGAEKLLGRGDMLYVPPGDSKPRRIQGTFVEDKEIEELIKYLRAAGQQPEYIEEVTTQYDNSVNSTGGGEGLGDVDDLFKEAVRICVEYDKASASLLQRRLSIGYARAARIIDQLEQAGVVSAGEGGSKAREVMVKNADEFLAKLQS